jgi:endonuclease/exonuclease/phosphatase family metal-dependent hydrolase
MTVCQRKKKITCSVHRIKTDKMNAKKKGKGKTFLRRFTLTLNIIAVLALLASYAANYISPASFWIFAFFGLAYPFILLLNLVFIVIWLITWNRFVWISIIAVSLGISNILSIIQFRGQKNELAPPETVKIISYNVHSLYEPAKAKSKGRMLSKVTDFLIQQKPDILCIQEFFLRSEDSLKVMDRLMKELKAADFSMKNYVDLKDKRKIFAIATFSKYPIVSVGHIRMNNRNVFAIYTDLLIGKDTVRVYNIHLESIRFGKNDYSFYAQLTDQTVEQDDKFNLSSGSLKILSKLKKAFSIRAQQVDILRQNMKNSPHPVIVCGDFNDTPASYTYHQMTSGLTDAFRDAGSGFLGSTYAGNFPSFRIDYILYDNRFTASAYERISIKLSDHYPVQAYLKINKKQ